MLKLCKERLFPSQGSSRNSLEMRQLTDEHSTTASVVLKTAEQRLKSTTTVMMEKTYIFWIVIIVMYVVSIVNFIMIICIWNIIGYNENPRILNTSPDNGSVLFTKPTECPTVYKEDGEILSFREQPLHVISNQQMTIRVKDKRGVIRDKFTMAADDGSIAFDGLKRFNVIMDSLGTTDTRRNVFDANVKTLDLSTTNLSILDVDHQLQISRLISPSDSSLQVKSDKRTRIRGNLGIEIAGRELNLIADGDIRLENINSSLYLFGKDVSFDMKSLPIVPSEADGNVSPPYKLCICMPSGKLFAVTIPTNRPAHLACSYVEPRSACFDRN